MVGPREKHNPEMASYRLMVDNSGMTYARDEAIKLIEWLLPALSPEDALAVEMPFLDVRRKADLLAVGPTRLSAIEIKGPRDNFRRLSEQLVDYQKMFLDVSLAVPEQHLAAARELIPREVGIVLLGSIEASWIRRPRVRRKLRAEDAARWLGTSDLSTLIGSTAVRSQGIEEARQVAARLHSDPDLTALALRSVSKRCQERFAAFLREKGATVDLDDLQLLALSNKLRVQSKNLLRQVKVDPNRDPE